MMSQESAVNELYLKWKFQAIRWEFLKRPNSDKKNETVWDFFPYCPDAKGFNSIAFKIFDHWYYQWPNPDQKI